MSVHRSRRYTWGGKTASTVSLPPDLLDELARVYAHAAVDALLAALNGEGLEELPKETNDSTSADNGPTSLDVPG